MNLWRFSIVVLSVATLSPPLVAQTVTITKAGVRADGKPIIVASSTDGGRAEHGHLTIDNHHSRDVLYEVHVGAVTRKFASLHGEDGKDIDLRQQVAGRLDTRSNRQEVFSVYANKLDDRPGVYQGIIRIEAWDATTKRLLGYADVPTVARLQPQRFPRQRPTDYEMWTTESGRLRRVRTADLPLRVYSNDQTQAGVVRRAVTVWNQAGATVRMQREFFRQVNDAREADLTIDWSGGGLPDGAAGAARLGPGSVIRGIFMRDKSDNARLAEVLVQELGHILGLEHSGNRDDIMAPPSTRIGTHRFPTSRSRRAICPPSGGSTAKPTTWPSFPHAVFAADFVKHYADVDSSGYSNWAGWGRSFSGESADRFASPCGSSCGGTCGSA